MMKGEPYALGCYIVANVTLRADSWNCTSGPVVAEGVAEADLALQPDPELEKHSLITTSFDAMPEVMTNMAIMNATNATLWNNIDG